MKPAIKDRHNVSRARRDPSSVACGIRNPSRDQIIHLLGPWSDSGSASAAWTRP